MHCGYNYKKGTPQHYDWLKSSKTMDNQPMAYHHFDFVAEVMKLP